MHTSCRRLGGQRTPASPFPCLTEQVWGVRVWGRIYIFSFLVGWKLLKLPARLIFITYFRDSYSLVALFHIIYGTFPTFHISYTGEQVENKTKKKGPCPHVAYTPVEENVPFHRYQIDPRERNEVLVTSQSCSATPKFWWPCVYWWVLDLCLRTRPCSWAWHLHA